MRHRLGGSEGPGSYIVHLSLRDERHTYEGDVPVWNWKEQLMVAEEDIAQVEVGSSRSARNVCCVGLWRRSGMR